MESAVISGIGIVHPFGRGSTSPRFPPATDSNPDGQALGGNRRMFHLDMPDLTTHPDHPSNKQLRYMRPEAAYAHIAASIAVKDAGLVDFPHEETALYTGTGPCYDDIWPTLKQGISASINGETFDLHRFGKRGRLKMNPFFSIRSLSALPMAAIAEKFGIRGENAAWGSFGAESASGLAQGLFDIQTQRCNLAVIGGLDNLSHPHKIESIYFNDFFQGDFYCASASCFIVLESKTHNTLRGGKRYGELLSVQSVSRPVGLGNDIDHRKSPIFAGFGPASGRGDITHIVVNPSGTVVNEREELHAAKRAFPNAEPIAVSKGCVTLLAAAEPFGTAMAALASPPKALTASLTRSVCGIEACTVVSKGEFHD